MNHNSPIIFGKKCQSRYYGRLLNIIYIEGWHIIYFVPFKKLAVYALNGTYYKVNKKFKNFFCETFILHYADQTRNPLTPKKKTSLWIHR